MTLPSACHFNLTRRFELKDGYDQDQTLSCLHRRRGAMPIAKNAMRIATPHLRKHGGDGDEESLVFFLIDR